MATSSGGFFIGIQDRNEKFAPPPSGYYVIEGKGGNDYVFSGNGDDLIAGGFGKDLLRGNQGNDTIFGDNYVIDENVGISLELSAAADAIFGDSGFDQVFAGGGANFVDGGSEADFIFGGAGNEHLNGGFGDDRIYGQGGNDRLFGGTASTGEMNSFVTSNFGTIIVTFNGIDDQALQPSEQVTATDRATQVLTFTGADYLEGGAGDDYIDGQDGADTLIGGIGNDLLDGGADNDAMLGGAGDDTYVVDNADDVVSEFEFQGIDEIYTTISTSLASNIENVTLSNTTEGAVGNALANRINGNASVNYLAGAEGNDTIRGLGGNDRLIGGLGQDMLTGGTESDKFIYNARNEGGDTVTDFLTGVDDFVFLGSAFGGLAAGALNPTLFQTGTADHALTPGVRFVYEEDTRILRYDPDGSGSAVGIGIATLQAGATMSASDFLIV